MKYVTSLLKYACFLGNKIEVDEKEINDKNHPASTASTNRVMLLSICSPIWTLMLLLRFTVMTNTKYSTIYYEENISSSPDLQEKTLMHDCSGSFWKRRLLYKNDLITAFALRSSNETSQFENSSVTGNVPNFKRDAGENVNERTLIDYDGPTIMEDLDNRGGQDYTNHVRVKRNEPRNKSIIYRPFIDMSNFPPQNFWYDNQSSYTSNGSMFKIEESYANPSYRNRSCFLNGTVMDTFRPRYKRGLLLKNGKRRKRVKGNSRHSKHHMRNIARKHGTISRKRTMKTIYNSGKRNKKEMETDRSVRAIAIDSPIDPKIKGRKFENSNFSNSIASITSTASTNYERVSMKGNISLLINDRNSDVKQQSNAILLPYVHTEEAELRVRIEKIPTNETSSLNCSTCPDYSSETNRLSVTPPKYITDKIINVNIINPETALNFDLKEKNETDNLTESTSEKSDYKNNACNYQMNDCGNTLSHNMEFNLHNIDNDGISKNDKYNNGNNEISAESLNKNTKSRAKRNQVRLSGTKALGMNNFKNIKERSSIAAIDEDKTHDNRAVRSIEEIKQLTEKLIAKVKELQTYASNDSSTDKELEKKTKALYVTDFCDNKNTNNIVLGKRRSPSENLNPKCKLIPNIDKHQNLIKIGEQTDSVKKRAYQTPRLTNVSKFARREYREKRKLHRKWGKWLDWSSCSVTCGKGRQIRWRHCMRDCGEVETEMEEKACQLPACPPGKFLGIF